MKKIIAMIMTGAIALSLTACSNSSGSAPSPSSNGTSSGNTAGASTDKAASDIDTSEYGNLDPVELVLADSAAKGAAGSTFDELVAIKVSEITGGQLTIDTHLNGELGNDTDLLRQMQNKDNAYLMMAEMAGRRVLAFGDVPVHKLGSDVIANDGQVVSFS